MPALKRLYDRIPAYAPFVTIFALIAFGYSLDRIDGTRYCIDASTYTSLNLSAESGNREQCGKSFWANFL